MSDQKYDDAEMCFLEFETELDTSAGGTHTGMYLAWAALRGLLGPSFDSPNAQVEVAKLKERQITGRDLYFGQCDGKLTDQDLNALGNAFTTAYYANHFYSDYERVFSEQFAVTGHESDDFCSIPDTWENTDRMIAVLDRRFDQWRTRREPEPAAPASPPGSDAAVPPAGRKASTPTLALEPLDPLDPLRERARLGDPDAWFDLGAEYLTGQRVPKDVNAAARAFVRAAELGSPDGQYNLGVCYQRGEGRPQDLQRAMECFSQAANAGHPDAIYQLALAFRSGNGMPQDMVASNALMLLAQAKGLDEAKKAGVMAGTMRESFALLETLRKPGQLLTALTRHRQAATASPAVPGPAAPPGGPTPLRPPTQRASRPAPKASASKADGPTLHLAHLALGVGAAAILVLLAMATSVGASTLKASAVILGLIGAFGVYRCSGDLQHGRGVRMLLTALALLPVAGSLVCIMVLLWTVRGWQER